MPGNEFTEDGEDVWAIVGIKLSEIELGLIGLAAAELGEPLVPIDKFIKAAVMWVVMEEESVKESLER